MPHGRPHKTKQSNDEPMDNEIALLNSRLQSSDTNERIEGLTTIALALREDDSSARSLLGPIILSQLVLLVSDSDLKVSLSAIGALRNALALSEPILAFLISNRLVPTLINILKVETKFAQENEIKDFDDHIVLIEQAISLLLHICEIDEESTKLVTSSELLKQLIIFVVPQPRSPQFTFLICQFLLVLTDANTNACDQISSCLQPSSVVWWRSCVSPPNTLSHHTHALISAIFLNLSHSLPQQSEIALEVVTFLFKTFISVNISDSFLKMSAKIKEFIDASLVFTPENDQPSVVSDVIPDVMREWFDIAKAQQVSIETVANLFSENSVEDLDENAMNDGDDMMNVEMDLETVSLSPKLVHAISDLKMFEAFTTILSLRKEFLDFVQMLPSSFQQCITICIVVLRNRTLCALNNIFFVLSDISEKDFYLIFESLLSVLTFTRSPLGCDNAEFAELSNNAFLSLWTLLRTVFGKPTTIPFPNLPLDLISQAVCSHTASLNSSAVKVIGVIAKNSESDCENANGILTVLLNVIKDTQSDVFVTAEALNAIMDAYDDKHVRTSKSLHLVEQLVSSQPALRQKLLQKNASFDRSDIVHFKETFINVQRFIDYKKQQKSV